MAHGQADYGMYQVASTIYGMADMGEMAARLGSIDTFDRRGSCIWLDDFEDGLYKWDRVEVGGGATWDHAETCKRSGMFSAMMQPAVLAGSEVRYEHRQPYTREGGLSCEASWSFAVDSGRIRLDWYVYHTVQSYQVGLRYDPATDTLHYLDNVGAWVVLDDSPALYPDFRLFHTSKLVVNTDTGKYARIMVDSVPYDLSAVSMRLLGGAASNEVYLRLVEEGGAAPVNYVYWDDVILKQNEPV